MAPSLKAGSGDQAPPVYLVCLHTGVIAIGHWVACQKCSATQDISNDKTLRVAIQTPKPASTKTHSGKSPGPHISASTGAATFWIIRDAGAPRVPSHR